MRKRNILLSVLLCIITCGIYYIYWFASLTNATNKLAPKHATMGGAAAVVCSVITAGIYYLYWFFRMGQKAGEIKKAGSDGLLYLLMGFFVGIIPLCMAQGVLNGALQNPQDETNAA